MTYDFSQLKKKTKELEEWLKKEHAQIRTGRATPALLDGIFVEAYGVRTPINQVGSMSVEDSRNLRITLWDMSHAKDVEKAIMLANLGVSVGLDDKGVRVSFPELTTERRTSLIKIAKDRLEQARVTMRKLRDESWTDIQKKEKQGGMSEDDKFRFKNEMEKIIQETNKNLESAALKKEKEIQS